MMAVERLSIKLQELFGEGFKILPYAQLCTDYTTARQVVENGNVGYVMDYTDEYSKIKKNNVVGIVNLQNPQRTNSTTYYLTSSFKIDFSIPTNVVKRDIYNQVLDNRGIDFFSRFETVSAQVIGQNIDFGSGFVGKIVLNEPVFNSIEDDGEIKYAIYTVTGAFNITSGARFGSGYQVYIKDDGGNYNQLDGINSFVEILSSNGNAIPIQGTTQTEQNLADTGWVCVVGIDDIEPTKTQTARAKIYDIIHNNKEIINENGTTNAKKRKLPVKIITPSGDIHLFNAIVSITFRTTSNGVGSYEISFTDDNKKDAIELTAPTITLQQSGNSMDITMASTNEVGVIYYVINASIYEYPDIVTPMPQGERYTDTITASSNTTKYYRVQAVCRYLGVESDMTTAVFTIGGGGSAT